MKNKFMKQFVALALSLIMLIGIMPMSASAVAYNTYDVSGRTQSGNNKAFIRYGLTDDAAGSFSVVDNGTSVQLNLTLNDGWYLEKWDTWFNGGYDKAWYSDPSYNESNPNFDDRYTFFNISQTALPTNAKFIFVSFLSALYGDFRVDAVVRPILTVNAGNGVNYRVTANNAISVEQGVAVEYGKNASVTYSVDDKHVITGISANYGTQYADNGSVVTVSSIVRPATVNISTRLKRQTVNFNANGGDGTMAAQTFEHSVAQGLTANAFTKNGYTFVGWNTKADNSGTSYANMASVSFTPANDGDSITLYAQWTQCTDHNWEDGKCTKCGALCSHSGGNATCIEQATCDICGEKYGDLAKHNVVYNASQNRIVETCTAGCSHIATADIVRDENVSTVYSGSAIKALKVVYSDNWQSGNLDIQYVENVNVGTASGTISIGGVTAKETFEITAATMTNVSAQGYSGVYDGQEHGITVNVPAGASVSYKVGDGNYSTENPVFKDAGTYTVAYKVFMANHTDVEGTAEVKIDKAPLTVTAKDHSIKYGEAPANDGVTCSGFVANENEDVLGGVLAYGYAYSQYGDVGDYDITVSGLTSANYEITYVKGALTVEQKEIDISWDATMFLPYTGSSLVPKAKATNLEAGDECILTTEVVETADGAGIIPGTWTAKVTALSNDNYKLPKSGVRVTATFEVINGYQNYAPDVTAVNETINGKNDGKITSVDSTMEYRKDGESTYTAITGTEITGLADGVYYVRYAAKTYYNPSPEKQITVSAGRMLNVTVPQNQIGYTLTVDKTEFEYMGGPTITLVIAEGYSKSENFAVKLNGKDMHWGDFTSIGMQSCTEDLVITVEGIVDNTDPIVEIDVKGNKWTEFWNDLTFGLFFNETQDVTITATDAGSKIKSIECYLAGGELELDEVRAITEWVAYNGTFKIDPNNRYVVYAKVVDNAGNTVYVNSDGIVLDNVAPTLEGIENGKTYYGDLTVIKSDEQFYDIKMVTLDGEPMGFAEGTYGLIPADNAEHTVVVEDHAGNKTTYTVTVMKNYTVTYKADGVVVDTLTVGHGKDATPPAVPAKAGYTGKWDHDGKRITSDIVINAVYTENSASAPSDPQPPQTGDNSHMMLWIALLLISGGALITLTVVDRKRRMASKR